MTKSLFIFFFTLLVISSPTLAKIKEYKPSGPLTTRSQNPLYLQILAMPMESPQTLKRNKFETSIQTTFSNIFEFDQIGNTLMNIDMELWRTALTFGYGLSDKLDVKIELPFLSNTGGFFDGFIQWYHDLFNFPNGGRELIPNGQFNYNLSQDGQTLFNFSSATIDLSDINLRFKYLLSDHWNWPFKLAIVPYLKIPTGRSSKGFGSGHFDLGLSVLGEKTLKRFHLTTQLGYIVVTGHNHLNPIMRKGFFSFGQSFEFQLWNTLSLIAQLTGNTSAFKNVDASNLNQIVLDLNIGVAGRAPLKHSIFEEFFYQWSFSEDILSTGPSVDFSILFLAGVRY